MSNTLYFIPKTGTILVTGVKFVAKNTDSNYWYRVYNSGRIETLKSKWDYNYFTKLVTDKVLIPISEEQAMSTFAVAAKPIIPDDWEFVEEVPRRPKIGEYFVAVKDNKIVCCDRTYSVPICRDNRRYIVKKKEVPMIKHIPFSGPGKYRLVNGQIVNLNEERDCLRSDNIKNKAGTYLDWGWHKDGTITGLGFPVQDNSLFLAEKIEEEEYYLAKSCSIFNHGVYWTKVGKDWWYHTKLENKYCDMSTETTFQDGIVRGDLIKCTKEDALKYYEAAIIKPTPPHGYVIADDDHIIKEDDLFNPKANRGRGNTKWTQAEAHSINTKVKVFTSSFDVATKIMSAPKMLVAKITNRYLTKGQSYEVVGDYHPKDVLFKVKVDTRGYGLYFFADCFELEQEKHTNEDAKLVAPSKPVDVLGVEDSKYFVAEKSTVSRFDYWITQPAKNFANVGRHVLFAAAVSSIIYGAVNPVKIVSVVKSCLPKVNIEWKQ